MIEDTKTAPQSSAWSSAHASAASPWQRQPDTPLARFLGGSPAGVLLRLFFLSLIVGALLMWLDIRPFDIFNGLVRFAHRIWALGFDAIREIGDYVLAGAVIVVPLWFVSRLLSARR